ncbi:MAG: VOC family protein [Syntrophobacteraceae bacterium]
MIKKIDHVAIAVKDLEASKRQFIEAFGAKMLFQKENPTDQYCVAIFELGENIVSLIASASPEGFIAKHIDRFGEGVQHIGIEVDDLDDTLGHWEQFGFKTGKYEEVSGVRRQVVLSPKNGFGVIFQVMEWLGEHKNATGEKRMGQIWS